MLRHIVISPGYSERASPKHNQHERQTIMDVTTTVMLSVYGASIVSVVGFFLRRIEHRIDAFEANVNRALERIDNKFEGVNSRLSNHGERISTLEGRSSA